MNDCLLDGKNPYNERTGEILLETPCCKGTVKPVGKGGALRVMSGNVELTDCQFVNNTASALGGSIFVDMKAKVTITRAHFETSPESLRLVCLPWMYVAPCMGQAPVYVDSTGC